MAKKKGSKVGGISQGSGQAISRVAGSVANGMDSVNDGLKVALKDVWAWVKEGKGFVAAQAPQVAVEYVSYYREITAWKLFAYGSLTTISLVTMLLTLRWAVTAMNPYWISSVAVALIAMLCFAGKTVHQLNDWIKAKNAPKILVLEKARKLGKGLFR